MVDDVFLDEIFDSYLEEDDEEIFVDFDDFDDLERYFLDD